MNAEQKRRWQQVVEAGVKAAVSAPLEEHPRLERRRRELMSLTLNESTEP